MNRIRELRQSQGRTIAELALRLGVTESTVRNWERGRHLPKSLAMQRKVARVLGVALPDLALSQAPAELRPLAAAVIPRGDTVLLTQRRFADHGEFWSWPSAKVEENERAEDALLRQLRDELLIQTPQVGDQLGEIDLPTGYRMIHFFVTIPDDVVPAINDYEQLAAFQWMTEDEAREAFQTLDHAIAAGAMRILRVAIATANEARAVIAPENVAAPERPK